MLCPCHSKQDFKNCCKPYLEKKNIPHDALKLMRSRYAAYALNKPIYIINTTHPLNPAYQKNKVEWERTLRNFCKTTKFISLEIIDFYEDVLTAYVTFKALLEIDGNEEFLNEKSFFIKEKNKWFYRSCEFF